MDFDLRDWLLILGPLFISAVLIHGYWRMRRGSSDLKMKLDKSFLSDPGEETGLDELSLLRAELPNGGARIASEHVPVLMEPVVIEPVVTEPVVAEQPVVVPEEAKAPPVRRPQMTKPEKFILINVLSDTSFNGQALLEILVELEMTFGEMEIFHRLDETGQTMFSLVNAVEPGSFNPATMDDLETPGITLFMRAHEVHDPTAVYDVMLEAAQTLALELGGELKDESRSAMTTQTIDHCRQGIQDFQYKHSA
jgi:cell division protein ZipA